MTDEPLAPMGSNEPTIPRSPLSPAPHLEMATGHKESTRGPQGAISVEDFSPPHSQELDTTLLQFILNNHRYINDYIRFADTKAVFLFGIYVALLGVVSKYHLFRLILDQTGTAWLRMLASGSIFGMC